MKSSNFDFSNPLLAFTKESPSSKRADTFLSHSVTNKMHFLSSQHSSRHFIFFHSDYCWVSLFLPSPADPPAHHISLLNVTLHQCCWTSVAIWMAKRKIKMKFLLPNMIPPLIRLILPTQLHSYNFILKPLPALTVMKCK